MTAAEYRDALHRLGLTQEGAAPLLGISPRTAQNYAMTGPSGPAALAIRLLLDMPISKRQKWLSEVF